LNFNSYICVTSRCKVKFRAYHRSSFVSVYWCAQYWRYDDRLPCKDTCNIVWPIIVEHLFRNLANS